MLIVEQNANLALKIAQRAYVLETGRFVFDGDAEAVQADESVRRAYLGY
jgi:branched-chain amino acid transport system ATP-binding protein